MHAYGLLSTTSARPAILVRTVPQSSPGAEVIGSVADQRVLRCNVWLGFDWAYGIGGKVGTTEADSIHLRHTSKVTAV